MTVASLEITLPRYVNWFTAFSRWPPIEILGASLVPSGGGGVLVHDLGLFQADC